LRVADGDMVEISAGERSVRAPIWITPGQADGVVTLSLGYGRTHAGRIGNRLGYDAYRLRTTDALWHLPGARMRASGGHTSLASTQHHFSMEGREIVRSATLPQYTDMPDFARRGENVADDHVSLYPPVAYEGYAWGMTVDLNACIGCNACTIACQAENNIPVVGKDQVSRGREMHWIPRGPLLRGQRRRPARTPSARAVHALRESAVRSRLSPSTPPFTATRASTTWCTTAVSAPATARTTVPTRCGASTSISSTTGTRRC
jgi:molybdopterin-containing oxidoreductase family iron-sulfur binding subunit